MGLSLPLEPKTGRALSLYPSVLVASVMSDSAMPWTVACQAPLSMEFSRQEYWSELPFPPPSLYLSPFQRDSLTS